MRTYRLISRINVVYRNGSRGKVSPQLLNRLIESKGIERFERSDGWVQVDLGPLRGDGGPGDFQFERRVNSWPPQSGQYKNYVLSISD